MPFGLGNMLLLDIEEERAPDKGYFSTLIILRQGFRGFSNEFKRYFIDVRF